MNTKKIQKHLIKTANSLRLACLNMEQLANMLDEITGNDTKQPKRMSEETTLGGLDQLRDLCKEFRSALPDFYIPEE